MYVKQDDFEHRSEDSGNCCSGSVLFVQAVIFTMMMMITTLVYFSLPTGSGHHGATNAKFMLVHLGRHRISEVNATNSAGVRMEAADKDESLYPTFLRIPRGIEVLNGTKILEMSSFEAVYELRPKNATTNSHELSPRSLRIRRDEDGNEDKAESVFKGVYVLRPKTVTPKSPKRTPRSLRIRRDSKKSKDSKRRQEDTFKPFEGTESSSCKIPVGLKTAEILCKMWPRTTICISYCAYGKTLDEGIKRVHVCADGDGVWSKDFEECQPFVDCKVRLIAPGNLQCLGNKLTESPSCEVSCDRYEDQEEVVKKTYRCKSKGTWEPELPFCVSPIGTPLVRAPKVVEHADISYPEAPKRTN